MPLNQYLCNLYHLPAPVSVVRELPEKNRLAEDLYSDILGKGPVRFHHRIKLNMGAAVSPEIDELHNRDLSTSELSSHFYNRFLCF